MARYISPLTDFGFKRLFGTEPNKEFLIDFLNCLLPQKHLIQDLQYTGNQFHGAAEEDRGAIFDLRCTSTQGEEFIIEMQKAFNKWFIDRSMFYATFPIREQVERGAPTALIKLNPVYMVGILGFVFFDGDEGKQVVADLGILNRQTCREATDLLNFIYLQLPNFTKSEEELESNLDKWLFVLRHIAELDERPPALKERIFTRFFEQAEIARYSPQEREAYEADLKHLRDGHMLLETAREQGREEGIEEGEKQKALQMARMMKTNGEPLEKIRQYTGLSYQEIRQL